jgi:hypothetical protein
VDVTRDEAEDDESDDNRQADVETPIGPASRSLRLYIRMMWIFKLPLVPLRDATMLPAI